MRVQIQTTYDERNRAHLMSISSHRDTKGSCKTKVGQLQIVTFIDKEILRLEVPMKDAMRMAVKQPRCELVSESLQKKIEHMLNRGLSDTERRKSTRIGLD